MFLSLFEIHCQIFKLLKKALFHATFCLFFKFFFAAENMKKLTSKAAHNQPIFFGIASRPETFDEIDQGGLYRHFEII
jgi:hypothetical protein